MERALRFKFLERAVFPGGRGGRYPAVTMRVWIDQDLCTGDGLCVDHCPDVFVQLEDGIAYVPGGRRARERSRRRRAAWPGCPCATTRPWSHAALDCPGECIFIEVDEVAEPAA